MKAREAPSSPDLPVDPRLVNILLSGVAHDPSFDTLEYFVSGRPTNCCHSGSGIGSR